MQFDEVVLVGQGRLRLDRELEDGSGHERVAVAVAADPRTHRDRGRVGEAVAEAVRRQDLEVALEAGDRREDARPVVAQRLVDLVADPQLREAQHGGVPQGEDREAEVAVDLGQLGRTVTAARPPFEQGGDALDHAQHGLATHLGRVCRDDRCDVHLVDGVRDRLAVEIAADESVEGRLERAVAGADPAILSMAAATFGVDVLGGVGEQRQPSERPDQMDLVVEGGVGQHLGQLGDRRGAVASCADR